MADIGADSMLLASAMRPLAELLRVKWSVVDRMLEPLVAIGTRVTVRPQHSTSAKSSAGQNQKRNPGLDLQCRPSMRYNPMVASERYSAATEDDRTMRWTEATHRAVEHGNHNGVARSTPPFCRYSAPLWRVDVVIDQLNELADLGADSMLLASAMRPLAELLRAKWSAVDRMLESSVAIGTRVTVRFRHSTSATSSAGRKQERIQSSNCRAVEKGGTIQWSHPGGTVPPRKTTEPCVGPKRRIGRMNMETTMAS
ncbi:hypothetical protein, partial [Stieleria varia]|uniref:hypothetical protein n=1 Tax=Stieleria varia TaxID=2528005 RepID=UPI0011B5B9F7